jgi:hypothetical protein
VRQLRCICSCPADRAARLPPTSAAVACGCSAAGLRGPTWAIFVMSIATHARK